MGFPYLAYQLLKKHKHLIAGDSISANKKCLMFGRAKMSLSKEQVTEVVEIDNISAELLQGWAEPFLKDYGYGWIESLDYSAFEGARYIWNLNNPLIQPTGNIKEILSTIDLVLDYGTSEHLFNPGMSLWNASALLNNGGCLNAVLPLHGFTDHGFYQFSPSFFYAIDRPEFRLEALYFVVHGTKSGQLMLWDGLSSEFREHVHGAFDGSFAANCLPLLNEKISAWALFRKISPVINDDFMFNTQQLIYKTQWSGQTEVSDRNARKLEIYNMSPDKRVSEMIDYIKSIALTNFI
jgi:hypothetical protein